MAPLREILTGLLEHSEAAHHLAGRVSGVDIRYDVGAGSHPLLGARLPRLALDRPTGHTTSTELLRTGRGLLLDLADSARLRRRARGWSDRIDIVTGAPRDIPDDSTLSTTTAALVRPDGHVAWAAPGTHHDLPTALERWFGPAR